MKEMVSILSQLYDKSLFSDTIQKGEDFWQSVFDGSLSSWTNRNVLYKKLE